MGETKEYVKESALSTKRDTLSGERGRVFDPIARIREAFTKLTSNVEQVNQDVVTDMFITLKQDIDSDPGNKQRIIIATAHEANHGPLAEKLSESIAEKFPSDESRNIAGAIAELYLRQIMSFNAFADAEGSRSRGHTRYNRTELLANAGNFWDASLKMSKFVQDRESQDALRFVTGEESPLRVKNIFDNVIKMVNGEIGVKFTTANTDGNQAFNFSRIRDAAPPISGVLKS